MRSDSGSAPATGSLSDTLRALKFARAIAPCQCPVVIRCTGNPSPTRGARSWAVQQIQKGACRIGARPELGRGTGRRASRRRVRTIDAELECASKLLTAATESNQPQPRNICAVPAARGSQAHAIRACAASYCACFGSCTCVTSNCKMSASDCSNEPRLGRVRPRSPCTNSLIYLPNPSASRHTRRRAHAHAHTHGGTPKRSRSHARKHEHTHNTQKRTRKNAHAHAHPPLVRRRFAASAHMPAEVTRSSMMKCGVTRRADIECTVFTLPAGPRMRARTTAHTQPRARTHARAHTDIEYSAVTCDQCRRTPQRCAARVGKGSRTPHARRGEAGGARASNASMIRHGAGASRRQAGGS